nr:U1 small nuclear ribonucleoprotein 70 kDa-like [Aegilops tauschii subsp. strangulata]
MTAMGDRRPEKRLMEAPVPEEERRREKALREQAKRGQRAKAAGRDDGGGGFDQGQGGGFGHGYGGSHGQGYGSGSHGREGNWGPPPPWWGQQEKKKKRKQGTRRRELERKPQEHPLCGGGHGDPLAKKPQASAAPLAVALPEGLRGSADAPILVEEEGGECFKWGRTGHFQAKCTFPPSV